MGGFIQYLTSAEATALLERVAATQAPGGVLYVRTSCPPRGGRGVPDDYYRPRTWYEPLFARLGYRVLDTQVSAAIVARSDAAFFGPGSRVIGRFAAWLHTRVIQRGSSSSSTGCSSARGRRQGATAACARVGSAVAG